MCRKVNGSWKYCPSRQNKASGPVTSPEPLTPVAVLAHHRSGLDAAQARAVYERAWSRASDGDRVTKALTEKWQQWCAQEAHASFDLDGSEAEADLYGEYMALQANPPATAQEMRACMAMAEAERKARNALRRQTGFAAAIQGVTAEEADERVRAFRHQYVTEFADLPEGSRPAPPEEWVAGFTSKDMMAVSTPRDPATLWALYRAQADPDAFGPRRPHRFASIDLETAGPSGKAGFEATNGCIIEVGIVTYDESGREVDRFGTLVRPAAEAEDTYRTGAVEVHGIGWGDVKDAPEWASVAPRVAKQLDGALLLAQNDRFEREWLQEHLSRAEQPFDRYSPGVDTMRIAQQHYSGMATHRLESICDRFGVAYTDGHRAVHDAEVAAAAFFAMRDDIHQTWRSHPVHGSLSQPGPAPIEPSRVVRLGPGEAHAALDDPWRAA